MSRILWLGVVIALAVPGVAGAAPVFYSIAPSQTFLRTDSNDTSTAALMVNLASLGISPGDEILLERLGAFRFCAALASCNTDDGTALGGVFSSSSTLLSTSSQFRVPGAIDAGADILTGTTLFDMLTTDIPEDFFITNHTTITVPVGAAFLVAGTFDSFFGDNSDPNSDFGLRITPAAMPVPEPASILLLGLGLCLVAAKVRSRTP